MEPEKGRTEPPDKKEISASEDERCSSPARTGQTIRSSASDASFASAPQSPAGNFIPAAYGIKSVVYGKLSVKASGR